MRVVGIGLALCEQVGLHDAGRPAPAGFKNYHRVNAPDMPDMKVLLAEHPGDDGPFGDKSVGEIAALSSHPCPETRNVSACTLIPPLRIVRWLLHIGGGT